VKFRGLVTVSFDSWTARVQVPRTIFTTWTKVCVANLVKGFVGALGFERQTSAVSKHRLKAELRAYSNFLARGRVYVVSIPSVR
jgi:hypothetical protein